MWYLVGTFFFKGRVYENCKEEASWYFKTRFDKLTSEASQVHQCFAEMRQRNQWVHTGPRNQYAFINEQYVNIWNLCWAFQWHVQSTLVITDTRYYGQNLALHPAKAIEVWLKMTPAMVDSRYNGLQTTSRGCPL